MDTRQNGKCYQRESGFGVAHVTRNFEWPMDETLVCLAANFASHEVQGALYEVTIHFSQYLFSFPLSFSGYRSGPVTLKLKRVNYATGRDSQMTLLNVHDPLRSDENSIHYSPWSRWSQIAIVRHDENLDQTYTK